MLARRPLALFVLLTALGGAPAAAEPPRHTEPPPDAAPRFVVYYNSKASPLAAAAETRFTHVILSFLGASADAQGYHGLTPPPHIAGQWDDVETLHAAGKRVLISFGGGLMNETHYRHLAGHESELAREIADFVTARGLDGIDLDFEASAMLHTERPPGIADGRAFLVSLTHELRQRLPRPRYTISHAPQAPYLDPDWHGGPYLDVLAKAGDAIDWISVQYYNNPRYDAPVAHNIVGRGATPPATSYRGLTDPAGQLGWSSDKVLVGLPVYKADAANGHLVPHEVARGILRPLLDAYGMRFGGLMGWQFSTLTADHRAWNAGLGGLLPLSRDADTR